MAKLSFVKADDINKVVKLNSKYSQLRKQLNISVVVNILQLITILILLCRF